MALMCFHAARLESRISKTGELILLKDQDRTIWSQEMIQAGQRYLRQASQGTRVSTYHFEAFIAWEHCKANTYTETNWENILQHYNQMLTLKFDPIVYLNKSLVVLQVHGPQAALQDIQALETHKAMEKYYLYHAAMGEIYTALDNKTAAKASLQQARLLTKSSSEQRFLQQKIEQLA